MRALSLLLLVIVPSMALGQTAPPSVYLWFEPEWFDGVQGTFAYWTGTAKPTGTWGVAGPGISPEWTQGGESEWNSMGAPAAETRAECRRTFRVPRAGDYKIWVRYVDHRKKTEPFRVILEQGGKVVHNAELGQKDVVPPGDEFQLWWGFSFAWEATSAKLNAGPAKVTLRIDRAGEGWRQVDALLLTDDRTFVPHGREKPRFGYMDSFALEPRNGSAWRGSARDLPVGQGWKRPTPGGRDFSLWVGNLDTDPKWWSRQDPAKLSLRDVFFEFLPPRDIREPFHKQFGGRREIPVLDWAGYFPGFYLGGSPDLSPDSPVRKWLEKTKTPFYLLTNYASTNYDDKTGPATYAALTGPLAKQFLGYIHGEAIGTSGLTWPERPLAAERRQHVDQLGKHLLARQAELWSKIYRTRVGPEHYQRSISCLSVESISMAHLFHEIGCTTVGYELDSTNAHAPMRVAFERGAARQYGGAWINYASGNFGDACNYFTQNPQVPRGAKAWFHSKYAETDGVTAAWYRKLYYLNYLGGASAIYWEQGLGNQWIKPGPGEHPIQLSPFGRGTEDFQAFVDRLPDRGEPYTPIAVLLSHGHGYERVNYRCKMLEHFLENDNDRELRELFHVLWHPSAVLEGKPASPDVQSMPGGVYGDLFDVLVDRPERAGAILNYPVVWAAGEAHLQAPAWQKMLADYLARGGTLVVAANQAKQLPEKWLGLKWTGKTLRADHWTPTGESARPTVPCELAEVELTGAQVLAHADARHPLVTRQAVGQGAVLVVLVPHLLGLDERAHPVLPWLMNGLAQGLIPVEVRLANGQRPSGEVLYQINRTRDGWLVSLMNQQGIDKTQTGIARVDRRQVVDVVVRTRRRVKSAREWTGPADLVVQSAGAGSEVRVRIHPGDVQVVGLKER